MQRVLFTISFLAACGGSKAAPPSNASSAGAPPYARTCVKAETGCMQLDCIDAVAADLIAQEGAVGCKTGDGTPLTPSEHDRAVHACYEPLTCAATTDGCEWTRTPALETCLAKAPQE